MLQCHALCGGRVLSCVLLYVQLRYAALCTTGRRAECDPALCAVVLLNVQLRHAALCATGRSERGPPSTGTKC